MHPPEASASSGDGITFDGLESLNDGDSRVLELLYVNVLLTLPEERKHSGCALPLAKLMEYLGGDEEDVLDALGRVSRVTIRIKHGPMTVTVPCLRFYELCESCGHDPVLAYRVPDEVLPYRASIATQLGRTKKIAAGVTGGASCRE